MKTRMRRAHTRPASLKQRARAGFLAIAMTSPAIALLASAPAASAHHSFGIFDMTKPLTLNGTVAQFQFVNPHGYVTLVVPDPAAPTAPAAPWRIEVANPNQLIRFGWKKDTVKPGDKIAVMGFRARDGSLFLLGREFTLADGRKVFGAPHSTATP